LIDQQSMSLPSKPETVTPVAAAAPTVQRKAAPLAAWFMLTAVMAAHFVVVATALTGQRPDRELLEVLFAIVGAGLVGAGLGSLSGLFDVPRSRGALLGAVMGGLAGSTAVCAALIPADRIDVTFHATALAALCIFASALMGRWQR
jgi:hypothetical protein